MSQIETTGPDEKRLPFWSGLALAWARVCRAGQLTVVFPAGQRRVFDFPEPGPAVTMELHNGRLLLALLQGGDLGLAESYMAGDWSTPDLAAVIEFGLVNEQALAAQLGGRGIIRALANLRFRLQGNTRAGARRNIAYHYDLGNDFYRLWLDQGMTYSSAVFTPETRTLEQAQVEKYRRIIEAGDIRPGHRVLEIGCGWGGFAEYAAREAGAEVTAITISREQAAFARQRLADAGLAERTSVQLIDYRDVTGTYDRIVSIEMFEAVGEENWPAYFASVRDRLVPGGKALLQVITVADHRFARYRQRVDFIQRYIFPGGMLPSPSALRAEFARAGLADEGTSWFGESYAATLRLWHERFQACWPAVAELGFNDRFRRMWTYYLNSCEACFRAGSTDVGHFLLSRPASTSSSGA